MKFNLCWGWRNFRSYFVELPTPPLSSFVLYLHINFISFPHWISMMNLLIFFQVTHYDGNLLTSQKNNNNNRNNTKCQMVQLLWRKSHLFIFYIYIYFSFFYFRKTTILFIIINSNDDRQTTNFFFIFLDSNISHHYRPRSTKIRYSFILQLGACIYLFTYKNVKIERKIKSYLRGRWLVTSILINFNSINQFCPHCIAGA